MSNCYFQQPTRSLADLDLVRRVRQEVVSRSIFLSPRSVLRSVVPPRPTKGTWPTATTNLIACDTSLVSFDHSKSEDFCRSDSGVRDSSRTRKCSRKFQKVKNKVAFMCVQASAAVDLNVHGLMSYKPIIRTNTFTVTNCFFFFLLRDFFSRCAICGTSTARRWIHDWEREGDFKNPSDHQHKLSPSFDK